MLAVSPANSDLANSDALKIAKEVDPQGEWMQASPCSVVFFCVMLHTYFIKDFEIWHKFTKLFQNFIFIYWIFFNSLPFFVLFMLFSCGTI